MKLLLILVLGNSLVYSQPAGNETFSCSFDDSVLAHSGSKELRGTHQDWRVFKWRGGKIPYYFKGHVTNSDKEVIRTAMREIQTNTCFKFQEKKNPRGHRLAITVGHEPCATNPYSQRFDGGVGYSRGSEELLLNSKFRLADSSFCKRVNKDNIVHELMHALGVMHTQKRPDREKYITVYTDNIEDSEEARFQYSICQDCDNHGVKYDCESVMHYGTQTKWNGRGPTMKAKNSNTCRLSAQGTRKGATATDWKLLKIIADKVC